MDRNKLKNILDLLVESPNNNIRLELLELFLTETEIDQLKARFDIIKGLIKGELTQREIAADLELSIAKITRGSNELKRRSPALLRYLNKKFARLK